MSPFSSLYLSNLGSPSWRISTLSTLANPIVLFFSDPPLALFCVDGCPHPPLCLSSFSVEPPDISLSSSCCKNVPSADGCECVSLSHKIRIASSVPRSEEHT